MTLQEHQDRMNEILDQFFNELAEMKPFTDKEKYYIEDQIKVLIESL